MDYDSDSDSNSHDGMSYYDDITADIDRIIKKVKLNEDGDGINIDEQIDDITSTLNSNNITVEPRLGDSDCYSVEKLLGYRIDKNGKKEYYVQWENNTFPPNWEPEENINSSLIRSFHINNEVKLHNNSIATPNGNAHLYLRVSDSSKTNSLFKQSQQQKQQVQQTTPTPQSSTESKQEPSKESKQSYFGDFPTGNFSLESQKEILIKYCVDNKLHISSIEMDDGISARNLSKLIGLQKIIENIQPRDVLLVLDLSRFSRHTMGGLQILEDMVKRNVRIYSVMDGMNYDTPASRHCVRTTISCAELESDIKSAKIKASIQNIKNMGGFIGSRAPFGYKIIRDGALRKLIKHSNEQKVLEIISDIMDTEIQCYKYKNQIIEDKLNDAGFTMRGNKFTSKNVKYIITKYINPTKVNMKNTSKPKQADNTKSNKRKGIMDTDSDDETQTQNQTNQNKKRKIAKKGSSTNSNKRKGIMNTDSDNQRKKRKM
jgi:DNA invertase Pin-like site-specific DNA recombinase